MNATNKHYRAIRVIGAACVALAGVFGLAARPARAGAASDPHALQLFAQARSYEAVMDIKESGADVSPADSAFHMLQIVVRHGNVSETYTTFKADGQTIQMVMRGDKMCVGVAGHWQCESGGPQFSAAFKATPDQLLKSLGMHVVYKSAGTKTIAGQPAVGYSFAAASSLGTETGTFWLDPSRQRVIAMDSAATDKVAGKTSSLSMKAVFTHWNDPGLKIPAIPGLSS